MFHIISCSLQMTSDAIHQYFKKNYGEVQRVEFDINSEYRSATAIFRPTQSAEIALKQKQHTICGGIVDVVEHIQQQRSFLCLNDDCINEIFKYVNGNDLSRIANTCTRLLGLARTHFTSKQNNNELNLTVDTLQVARDGLWAFGPFVQSIRLIHSRKYPIQSPANNKILHLLLKYCKKTLKKLELHQFAFYHLSESTIDASQPLFFRLQKLTFKNCSISNRMLTVCDEVGEMELNGTIVTKENANHRHKGHVKTMKILTTKRRFQMNSYSWGP